MTRFSTITSMAAREVGRFRADEGGATVIEYAMIASAIGAAVAAAVYSLGEQVNTLFTAVFKMMT
jgi:Flp pilus assembly pilin Flp